MRGFILAAGFGTRLRPITDYIPKALVSVAGKPLLERSLNFLKSSGIDTIGVNSHYLPDQLYEFKKKSSIPFQLYHEENIRGTGGALYNAREFLEDAETFIVANVDIVCEFDLQSVIQSFNVSENVCTLIAFSSGTGKGTILYDENTCAYKGTVAETSGTHGSVGADFIGIALYKKEFLSLLAEGDFSIVPVWGRAANKGMPVSVHIVKEGYWRDTGKPQDLAQIYFDILDRKMQYDIPDYMSVNFEKKSCVNRTIPEDCLVRIGPYTWIETDAVPDCGRIKNCIILKKSNIESDTPLISSLVTPWGAFNLHE
jgi:NDP-sugar pyrophosphorylase family protein